ncbi:hypothetical protein IWZ00DRAFT_493126 [Phyllosticta capitalensis]|uniref:Uncharacterized protein n=1 Tax=Phyllosticta capitalensis TaxID=121624 RepID=A0ABR1YCJ2_9PEZI
MATQRPDMAPTTDGLEAPLSAEREDDSVEAQTGKCEDIDTCKDGEANDDVADINAQSKSRTRIGHEETAHRCVEMFDQGLNDLKNDVDRANLDASLGKQGLCAKVKMETDDQFIGNINSNHASQSSARMEKTPLRETFREITRHSESGGLVNGQEGGETSGLKIPTEPNKDLSSVDALFEERAQSHNDKAISSSLQRSGQANTSQERPTLTGVEELPLEVRGSVEATGDSSANLRTNSGLEKFITTAETLDQDRIKKLVRGPMLEDMYQELDNLPRNPRARVNMAFKTFRFRAIGAVERRKQDLMDSKWTPWADSPFVQHLKGDSLHSAVMHEFAELERCLREHGGGSPEARMTRLEILSFGTSRTHILGNPKRFDVSKIGDRNYLADALVIHLIGATCKPCDTCAKAPMTKAFVCCRYVPGFYRGCCSNCKWQNQICSKANREIMAPKDSAERLAHVGPDPIDSYIREVRTAKLEKIKLLVSEGFKIAEQRVEAALRGRLCASDDIGPGDNSEDEDHNEEEGNTSTIRDTKRTVSAPEDAQRSHQINNEPTVKNHDDSLHQRSNQSPNIVIQGKRKLTQRKLRPAAKQPNTRHQSSKRPCLRSPSKQPSNVEKGKTKIFELTDDEEYNEKSLDVAAERSGEREKGLASPPLSKTGEGRVDGSSENMQHSPAPGLDKMAEVEFWNKFEKLVADELPDKWEAKQVVGFLGGCWQSKQDPSQRKQRPHLSAGGAKAMTSDSFWNEVEEWMASELKDRWRAKEVVGFLGKCWHST